MALPRALCSLWDIEYQDSPRPRPDQRCSTKESRLTFGTAPQGDHLRPRLASPRYRRAFNQGGFSRGVETTRFIAGSGTVQNTTDLSGCALEHVRCPLFPRLRRRTEPNPSELASPHTTKPIKPEPRVEHVFWLVQKALPFLSSCLFGSEEYK